MSSGFKHLQYEQRKRIRQLMDDGVSIRAIARSFGMAPNSIYREVKRGTPEGSDRYDPDYAQARYRKMYRTADFRPYFRNILSLRSTSRTLCSRNITVHVKLQIFFRQRTCLRGLSLPRRLFILTLSRDLFRVLPVRL